MASLNLEVSEDLRHKLASRAIESGHPTVEQYLVALAEADTEGIPGDQSLAAGPAGVLSKSDDEIEAELVRRLDDGPGIEVTPAFWQTLRDRVNQHRTA